MTVKIYVAKDSAGNEWAPDYTQEVSYTEWMLKNAWLEFHHLPTLYCIISNLYYPSADLVVMTERGIGVLELKHNSGEITIGSNGSWYSNHDRINAGKQMNPRTQVQNYAQELRKKIIHGLLPQNLKKDPTSWDDLKFQTGVCFTNPAANFSELAKQVAEKRPQPWIKWESNFSVIGPDDFTSWVRELRFQVDKGRPMNFQPIRLNPTTIEYIAKKELDLVEWKELIAAMPEGEPYGYLILDEQDGRQIFNLQKDEILIGRSPDCDIVIPDKYRNVSKRHCKIIRNIHGVELVDLDSTNGTFLEGNIVSDKNKGAKLSHSTKITLGGSIGMSKACKLSFELREQFTLKPPSTELG